MPFVIGAPCIDMLDKTCMDVCPVDCIYEGKRKLYINPAECIDCGVCVSVCPVEAIRADHDFDGDDAVFVQDNSEFFSAVLAGHDEPLGNPGGARRLGSVGVDTVLVESFTVAS